MKIAIVATYYQRQAQLVRTLKSIEATKHRDFEVIIIDDCSPDPFIQPETNFPVTVIRTTDKDWTDCDIPANIGLLEALNRCADIIIMQNAECYHVGDVLTYAERVTDSSYISFSCFSESQEYSGQDYNIDELILNNDKSHTEMGGIGWYNHPIHRPCAFDFCAAMTRKTLIDLNGFDERFSYGVAYGDDDLIRRVRKLGLEIEIPVNPFVVHQWHPSMHRRTDDLGDRNIALYRLLTEEGNTRAAHIKTPDFK